MRAKWLAFGAMLSSLCAIVLFLFGGLAKQSFDICTTNVCKRDMDAEMRIYWFLSMLCLGFATIFWLSYDRVISGPASVEMQTSCV